MEDAENGSTFTATWTAKQLNINKGTYFKWELDRALPTPAQLSRLSQVLRLSDAETQQLLLVWLTEQLHGAAEQLTDRPPTRAEARAAVAAALGTLGALAYVPEEQSQPGPAYVRFRPFEPVALEQLLRDTRYHLVNADQLADRVLAKEHLDTVERATRDETDPVFVRLRAWEAHLRGSYLLERGLPREAEKQFRKSGALALDLPDPPSPGEVELSRGNLWLSASYGAGASALAAGRAAQAVSHLQIWLRDSSMLNDPAPQIWRSATYRTAIDALLGLEALDDAFTAFQEAIEQLSQREPFDALTPDAQLLMLDSQARLLVRLGKQDEARECLLAGLAQLKLPELARPGAISGRARIEMRLVESLLFHVRLLPEEWHQLAERAMELHRQVGFPKSISKIRRRHRRRWIAFEKQWSESRTPQPVLALAPRLFGIDMGDRGHSAGEWWQKRLRSMSRSDDPA